MTADFCRIRNRTGTLQQVINLRILLKHVLFDKYRYVIKAMKRSLNHIHGGKGNIQLLRSFYLKVTPKLKNLNERATLFKITSNAMINACSQYLELTQTQVSLVFIQIKYLLVGTGTIALDIGSSEYWFFLFIIIQ
jgi:hypothetical protein